MAFDGTLLNRPSAARAAHLDGAPLRVHGRLRAAGRGGRLARRRRRRRPAEPALQARPPLDRDREADRAGRRRRLRRDGDAAAGQLSPSPSRLAAPLRHRRARALRAPSPTAARLAPACAGRWTASASRPRRRRPGVGDDAGVRRQLRPIGYLATAPRSCSCPDGPRGADRVEADGAARVVVTVETPAGEILRTLAQRSYPPGAQGVAWNGLDRARKAVKGGTVRRPRRREERARGDRALDLTVSDLRRVPAHRRGSDRGRA